MFRFLKKHWFWIIVDSVLLLYFIFLGLIFFAPRIDKLNRGFIPCTQNLVEEVYHCQKKGVWCTLRATLKNNVCDFNVVKTGFVLWLNGQQKTPFTNYYFEPILEDEPDVKDEELKVLYQQHLDLFKDMEELNKNRIELEKKIRNNKTQTHKNIASKEETKEKEKEKENEESK